MQIYGIRNVNWKAMVDSMKIFSKLIALVRPMLGWMILAILMGVLGFLCAIFIPFFAGMGVLSILAYSTFLKIRQIILCLFLFALARGILRYAEQACNHYIAFKLLARIRDLVFGVLRKLSPAKLEGKDKGDLVSLISSDVELLEVFYAHTISPVCIAFLVSFICICIQASFHPYLAIWAFLSYGLVGVILPIYFSKQTGDIGKAYRNEASHLNSYVLESMRGLKESLQYNATQERLNGLIEHTHCLTKQEKKLKENQAKDLSLTNFVVVLSALIILILNLQLKLDFNTLVLSTILEISSFGPVIALANLGTSLSQTLGAAQRILSLLEEAPIVEEVVNGVDCEIKDVQMDSIDFSYDQEVILKDFSFAIEDHKVLGIQGKSGCGKSTLLKLLMRFWDVSKGNISMSQRNIKEINTSSLRKQEGYMMQETILFHDTIEANLKVAKEDATQEEMESACRKANIHDFIESLPKGYQSMVGELGSTLSAGERQRIGLARMFLHDASLLLFDEPTSNLDSLNEGMILKTIYAEKENKTIVFVSHSKSTLKHCDQILHMESGRQS